jgi:hypothetical protein
MSKQKTAAKYNPFESSQIGGSSCSFVVGTESGNTINLSVQLGGGGLPEYQDTWVTMYLSSTPDGQTPATLVTSWAIGTNGVKLWDIVTKQAAVFLSNATGLFDVNLVDTGGSGHIFYPVLLLPDGNILVGPEITF